MLMMLPIEVLLIVNSCHKEGTSYTLRKQTIKNKIYVTAEFKYGFSGILSSSNRDSFLVLHKILDNKTFISKDLSICLVVEYGNLSLLKLFACNLNQSEKFRFYCLNLYRIVILTYNLFSRRQCSYPLMLLFRKIIYYRYCYLTM